MNAHNDYADRKNLRQKVKPIHPELEEPLKEILSETYGLIVYQEQIMFIAQKVAGYSMGRADVLRKAMGKKKIEVLEKEFEGFRDGMRENGFSDEAVQALWDTILPFAGYAFNKSHAACYALVGYWTAYLKANYQPEYMAALLTSVGDNKDKSALYLAECRRLGGARADPGRQRVDRAILRRGLRHPVRARGDPQRRHQRRRVDRRHAQGQGQFHVVRRLHGEGRPRVLQQAHDRVADQAGAFDAFGQPRRALLMVHEDAVDAVTNLKRKEAEGQFDLFGDWDSGGDDGTDVADHSPLAWLKIDDEEWPRKQKLAFEREMLGLYVSAHPLDGTERILRKHAPKPIASVIDDAPKEGEIVLAG